MPEGCYSAAAATPPIVLLIPSFSAGLSPVDAELHSVQRMPEYWFAARPAMNSYGVPDSTPDDRPATQPSPPTAAKRPYRHLVRQSRYHDAASASPASRHQWLRLCLPRAVEARQSMRLEELPVAQPKHPVEIDSGGYQSHPRLRPHRLSIFQR